MFSIFPCTAQSTFFFLLNFLPGLVDIQFPSTSLIMNRRVPITFNQYPCYENICCFLRLANSFVRSFIHQLTKPITSLAEAPNRNLYLLLLSATDKKAQHLSIKTGQKENYDPTKIMICRKFRIKNQFIVESLCSLYQAEKYFFSLLFSEASVERKRVENYP